MVRRRFSNRSLCLLMLPAFGPRTAHAEGATREFAAIARSGPRPEECGGRTRGRVTRWEQARVPGLSRYCDTLARGYSALARAPERSLGDALSAATLLPGRPAPLVLAARAETALGKYTEAFEHFEKARALAPASVESPGALHDLAIAAVSTGHAEQAAVAYRTLVPRVELIDDDRERTRVFVEGAIAAMNRGPEHLAEATGYLLEARRAGIPLGLEDYVLGTLALAYARQGRDADAAAVAGEASGPWRLEADRGKPNGPRAEMPVVPPAELDLIIALLAESRDRELSLERLQSSVATAPAGPFAAWARARRESLLRAKKGQRS